MATKLLSDNDMSRTAFLQSAQSEMHHLVGEKCSCKSAFVPGGTSHSEASCCYHGNADQERQPLPAGYRPKVPSGSTLVLGSIQLHKCDRQQMSESGSVCPSCYQDHHTNNHTSGFKFLQHLLDYMLHVMFRLTCYESPWLHVSRWPWLRMLGLMLLCLSPTMVRGQIECSPETDCQPPAQDLLVPNGLTSPYRTVEVSSTCGVPLPTAYRMSIFSNNFTDFECGSVGDTHPASGMLDRANLVAGINDEFTYQNPELLSHWQSENTFSGAQMIPTEQWVVANFSDPFLIRTIRLIFVSPFINDATSIIDMRPRAMYLQKKTLNTDEEWQPIRYYSEDCSRDFPEVTEHFLDDLEPDYAGNVVVCERRYFAGDTDTHTGWGHGRQEVWYNGH